MRYLIDTDVIIDHLRGDDRATNILQMAEDGLLKAFISVVTEYELLACPQLSSHEEKKITDLIEKILPSLTVTSHVAKIAATFHRKYATNVADAIIAATAYHAKATLITRNTKHFCITGAPRACPWNLFCLPLVGRRPLFIHGQSPWNSGKGIKEIHITDPSSII